MQTVEYVITDPHGIHARPAGMLVRQTNNYTSTIHINKDGKSINAKSILGVMSLAIKQGDQISLTVTGEDEEQAAQGMRTFFEKNL